MQRDVRENLGWVFQDVAVNVSHHLPTPILSSVSPSPSFADSLSFLSFKNLWAFLFSLSLFLSLSSSSFLVLNPHVTSHSVPP